MNSRIKGILVSVAALSTVVSLALACGGAPRRPDGGVGLLPVGASAPDLVAKDAADQPVRLSGLRGRPVVVFFYPKDETPGCTKEACAFRDAWNRYEHANVAVLGVSRDSEESHKKFIGHHKLPFPLVADEDGHAQEAYGVSSFIGMSSRVTFLVGADGKVLKVWPDVDPGLHADEVLAAAGANANGG